MMCRNRWAGLEQEGFGIVFVEAAACGIPQVAGDSGGAAEAVLDGETGYVMADTTDPDGLARRIDALLSDPVLWRAMSEASRRRATAEFDYDVLSTRLGDVLGVAR